MVPLQNVIDEMVEFGLAIEVAEFVAPAFLPLYNDPRGFAQALIEECPSVAEMCGALKRH